MKTFEEIIYDDSALNDYEYKYENNKKPLLYSLLGIILSFVPLLNILGMWFSVKSVEEYKWQNKKSYLGWVSVIFSLVSIFLVAVFVTYVFIIYPEFKDPCAGLQAGKYISEGERFTCP